METKIYLDESERVREEHLVDGDDRCGLYTLGDDPRTWTGNDPALFIPNTVYYTNFVLQSNTLKILATRRDSPDRRDFLQDFHSTR